MLGACQTLAGLVYRNYALGTMTAHPVVVTGVGTEVVFSLRLAD